MLIIQIERKINQLFYLTFCEYFWLEIFRSIAFASRRLSRNSRIAIDLAQVSFPKKFEAEGPYVEKSGEPAVKDQIMVRLFVILDPIFF